MQFDTPMADEYRLIFDSWARSWMKSPWSGTFRNCDYDAGSRAMMSEIIDRPGTRVTVLWVWTEDEVPVRRVVGYSVSEPARKVMHWVYVKDKSRGAGIGRRLVKEVLGETDPREWVYTHKTNACAKLFRGMRHDKAKACCQLKV